MIIGHKKIIKTLQDLAGQGTLNHGYLFSGPKGVGKSTIAQAFAGFLEGGTFEISHRVLSDMQLVSLNEKNSLGIDDIRAAQQFLFSRPNTSSRRTLIIDSAESLTPEAQNALLKITEEPPSSALIILVVTDPELLLPTLRSRFQEIYFGYVDEGEIIDWLTKTRECTAKEAQELARKSFGAPGRAIALKQDEVLQQRLKYAEQFLSLSPTQSKTFLKDLLDQDDFNFTAFLDALILHLASSLNSKSYILHSHLWHSVLELRGRLEYANLSPRIQLENLTQKRS